MWDKEMKACFSRTCVLNIHIEICIYQIRCGFEGLCVRVCVCVCVCNYIYNLGKLTYELIFHRVRRETEVMETSRKLF